MKNYYQNLFNSSHSAWNWNVSLFEKFIVDYFTRFPRTFAVSSTLKNLKLILKSESTLPIITWNCSRKSALKRSIFQNLFWSSSKSFGWTCSNNDWYLSVSAPLFKPNFLESSPFEQLERLERLTGCQVFPLMLPDFEYFKYRIVFKVHCQTGQNLPKDLPRFTEDLVELDR